MEVVQQQRTTVAILMRVMKQECGAIQLTRMCDGNCAMFHYVRVGLIAMFLLHSLRIPFSFIATVDAETSISSIVSSFVAGYRHLGA